MDLQPGLAGVLRPEHANQNTKKNTGCVPEFPKDRFCIVTAGSGVIPGSFAGLSRVGHAPCNWRARPCLPPSVLPARPCRKAGRFPARPTSPHVRAKPAGRFADTQARRLQNIQRIRRGVAISDFSKAPKKHQTGFPSRSDGADVVNPASMDPEKPIKTKKPRQTKKPGRG